MSVSCDGQSCCKHEPENRVVVMRDGEARGLCTECRSEVPILSVPEPLPPASVPVLGTLIPEVVSRAIPCGDDIGTCQLTQKDDEIAHRWGWL